MFMRKILSATINRPAYAPRLITQTRAFASPVTPGLGDIADVLKVNYTVEFD